MKKHHQTCIIDDDAIAVFGLKRAMATIGLVADLIVFENGLDALEHFEENIMNGFRLPSLILIDLNMPVLDGWGFMEEFVKIHPAETTMPDIFIMTSSIDVKDLEKAKHYKLEGNYLIKPVTSDVLRRVII